MILSANEAASLADEMRGLGKIIVFTNGCFDIVHPGHIHLLRTAKSLGDVLLVGLNDDGSVRRLKGPERPINPLEARAEVLSAIRYVDHVIPFSEDTPLELIEAIRPDVLVKGGDWREDEIVGAEFVRSRGGEVVIVPYLEGYSTTGLLQKLGLK
ncbi:MAG: D-glycero-beta-D-manno-heptose 1-phosphate adenylyltransferase [candidate division WOR-3 bacterium]